MEILYTFLICFIIIYGIYYLVIIRREKGMESFKKGKQLEFFKTVYKINVKKIDIKKFANSLALTNAFIMSLVISIIELIDNTILKMLTGFVLLIVLMVLFYKVLGNYYKKKEGK